MSIAHKCKCGVQCIVLKATVRLTRNIVCIDDYTSRCSFMRPGYLQTTAHSANNPTALHDMLCGVPIALVRTANSQLLGWIKGLIRSGRHKFSCSIQVNRVYDHHSNVHTSHTSGYSLIYYFHCFYSTQVSHCAPLMRKRTPIRQCTPI